MQDEVELDVGEAVGQPVQHEQAQVQNEVEFEVGEAVGQQIQHEQTQVQDEVEFEVGEAVVVGRQEDHVELVCGVDKAAGGHQELFASIWAQISWAELR